MDAPSTIAHYRITAKLGEGGMGAVYRATDTKLNRNVAVKVLPAEFAADTGRMQRFEREAQVLAALNHPNIAAIYGIEAGAIVMELVEGEDLRGPVPANVAIGYARQMIGALEAAHEKGIVHRDLKPANIRVTADGVVKLLDFGLAKATEASAAVAGASPTISPTLSIGMTQAGMILGTAAYMSPEQARGKTIDQRADIWAFGVILYELLTGTPLYGGETITDTLAAVVLQEPDYSRLPVGTPSGLRRLIRGCLQKDPKTRLREIGDARLLLEEVETPSVAVAPRRSWLPWAVAAVAVAGTGVLASQWPKAAAPPVTVRFPLELPEGTTDPQRGLAAAQAVPSPDGKRLAFIAASNGKPAIWIRSMDSPVAHRLDRTEGASLPFWSPDGQFLGYFEEGRLKKIPAAGGAPQTLAQFPQTTSSSRLSADGGAWGPDGTILYSPGDGPLMRTTASGGNAAPATALDEAQQEYKHASPQFLPDGKHVVYFAGSHDRQKNGIYVLELGSSRRTLLRRNPTRGAWGAPDYLLFLREGTLFAQRTNLDTGRATGEPMRIAEEVTGNEANGRTSFALSDSGVLVYRAGNIARRSRLAWLDRQGNRLSRIGGEGRYRSTRLSPDEKSAAVVVGAEGGYDIATIDLSTGVM